MADKEKKVMDVANPGDAKPDIGSKPMIIGHKSTASDPMVKQDSEKTEDAESAKKPVTKTASTGKKLQPISEDMKSEESVDEEPAKDEEPKKTDEKASEAKSRTDDKSSSVGKEASDKKDKSKDEAEKKPKVDTKAEKAKDDDTEKENDKDDKKLDPTAIAMEQEENLRKIVESKKYFVDIKEKKSGNLRTFLFVFLGLVLSGFIALFVLVDTGTIESSYELPFRIFGSEEDGSNDSQPTAQVVETVIQNDEEQEEVTELTKLSDSSGVFSFSHPSEWAVEEYVWQACCSGEDPIDEPDWTITSQPITLIPESDNTDIKIEITGFNDGSMTLGQVKDNATEDSFNSNVETMINGYDVFYNKLDFVGPDEAEKYTDFTYYFFSDDSTVKIYFREKYSNVTIDESYSAKGMTSDQFDALVESVEFSQ